MFKLKLSIIIVLIILTTLTTSCDFTGSVEFENANTTIHKMYAAFNSDKKINLTDSDLKKSGRFKALVKLEQAHLTERQNKNKSIESKVTEINKYEFKTKESIDKYVAQIDEVIKLINDNANDEKTANKKLITDIKKLKIPSSYIDKYLKFTADRIKFEEGYTEKINAKNIEALEVSKTLMSLYKENNVDLAKASALKTQLSTLNKEYEDLILEFDKKIAEMMDTKIK